MNVGDMGNLDWCRYRSVDVVMGNFDPVWFDPKSVKRGADRRQKGKNEDSSLPTPG